MTRPLLATPGGLVGALLLSVLTASVSGCLPGSPKAPDVPDLAAPPDMTVQSADMAIVEVIPVTELTARQYFDKFVLPSLSKTCKGCHGTAGGVGPPFMESSNPDRYDPYNKMQSWNNFVVDTPELSALIKKGSHEGPALAGSDTGCTDQCEIVLTWLKKEKFENDRTKPVKRSPQTKPFYPKTDGTYTKVQLEEISPLFKGAYLNFKVTLLPSNRGVEISDLRFFNIKADALMTREQRTIRMVHPLFSTWKNGAPLPDPVDNFQPIDKTVRVFADDNDAKGEVRKLPPADPPPRDEGVLIVPGLFTLSDFRIGDALNVAFTSLELLPPIAGENPCSAEGLAKFKDIRPYLAKTNGANANCGTKGGCHTAMDSAASLDVSAALQNPAAGAESAEYKALCERLKFYNQTGGMVGNVDPDPALAERHPQFKYNTTTCTNLAFPANCHALFKAAVDAMRAVDP